MIPLKRNFSAVCRTEGFFVSSSAKFFQMVCCSRYFSSFLQEYPFYVFTLPHSLREKGVYNMHFVYRTPSQDFSNDVSTFLAVVKELKLPSFEATDLKEV
jgi:hypothetical protein